MSKLTLEKDETGLRVTIMDATPIVQRADDDKNYEVRFSTGAETLVAVLTPSALHALGMQCVAHIPAIAPHYTVASVEEAFRVQPRLLKDLDDRSIQLLLRECQSDSLIIFLWYMKDAELIKKILKNCSARAAEMLFEDLESIGRGKDPDNALEVDARRGRDAVLDIMNVARRLMAEGQIESVFGDER